MSYSYALPLLCKHCGKPVLSIEDIGRISTTQLEYRCDSCGGMTENPLTKRCPRCNKLTPRLETRCSSCGNVLPLDLDGMVRAGIADPAWLRPERPSPLRGRGLTEATINAARLGWVRSVMIPKRDGVGYFKASGIAIPWINRDHPTLVKIRRPEGRTPKYVEAFRDHPRIYPGPEAIWLGAPLVITEGELDALLLGQELGGAGRRRDLRECVGPARRVALLGDVARPCRVCRHRWG
jgi:hypothetical protein